MSNQDLSVIFSGNIVEADLLKCLLEGAGIPTLLRDEFIGAIAPYTAAPGGVGAVKVMVENPDVEQARRIVADFIKTHANNKRSNLRVVK